MGDNMTRGYAINTVGMSLSSGMLILLERFLAPLQ